MTGAGIRSGVIGWPIEHSLSPRLHGFWLKRYGIDGSYERYSVPADELETFIWSLPERGFAGCNVTLPHKEQVLSYVDEVDDLARAVGAANTIIVRGGKLYATNTDIYGFAENIRPSITQTGHAVVLGAGGAAKGVCKALQDLGFAHITITNRTQGRAEQVAQALGGALHVAAWEEREAVLEGADLLVNTTSLGLAYGPKLELSLDNLPSEALVTDIVYNPLITPLLAQAKARGNPVVDGLGMLLHQAVPGFSAWFGVQPVVDAELRAHVLAGIA
jgi:shikimate dehydrogenase